MNRLRSVFYTILVAIIPISVVSCLRDDDRLRTVELLMETDPKVADSILTSMPEPTSRRDRAWYAVLRSLADYKNDRTITSDSLIRAATDYYGSLHKNYHAAVAWYAHGCVDTQLKNDYSAIYAFLKAKDLFPDTLVHYYALTEYKLGNGYLNLKMYNEAMNLLMCSRINADRLQDTVTSYWANVRLFECALQLGHNKVSDSILNTIVFKHVYEALLDDTLFEGTGLGYRFVTVGEEDDRPVPKGPQYSSKGYVYLSRGDFDSAYYCFRKSMELSTSLYGKRILADNLTRVSMRMNKPDEAIYWHDYYRRLSDSIRIAEKTDAKDIADIQNVHLQELNEERMQHRHKRFMVIGSFSLLLLVALTLLAYMLFKNREKKRIIRRQEELLSMEQEIRKGSIAILESQVRELSQANPQARTALLNLYAHRLRLGSDYFRKTNEYRKLLSAASGGTLSAEEKALVMTTLAQSFNDSVVDIQVEYPGMDKDETLTLILSSLGFKNELIAELLGNVTDEAIRKRKYRFGKANPDFFALFH